MSISRTVVCTITRGLRVSAAPGYHLVPILWIICLLSFCHVSYKYNPVIVNTSLE